MKRDKGYTLIEILIVIALVSIFFAMAIPSTNLLHRRREKQEIMELYKDIIYIRNNAIMSNKIYSLYIWDNNRGYYIKNDSDNELIKKKEFENKVRFTSNNFSECITFNSSGVPKVGGHIILRDGSYKKYKLTILPATGKITLKKDD